MDTASAALQRRLLMLAAACALIFLADVIMLNVLGEVPSGWWVLVVPVGLVLVPLTGLVALAVLVLDRLRS